MSESRTHRVLIVEDHPIVCLGLRHLLERQGFEVCGEAASLAAASRSPALGQADLVTMDLSLGGEDGLDLVRQLNRERPGLPVLIYSMFEDSAHIDRALRAGARGYITKSETFERLAQAIHACLAGARYLSPIAERNWTDSAEARRDMEELSVQEHQAYRLLSRGLATAEIAGIMHVSPRTVESYFGRVQSKLGVKGMKELRRQALRSPI